jgi:hypothetical protein
MLAMVERLLVLSFGAGFLGAMFGLGWRCIHCTPADNRRSWIDAGRDRSNPNLRSRDQRGCSVVFLRDIRDR